MVDQESSVPIDNSSADEVSTDTLGSNRSANVNFGRRRKKKGSTEFKLKPKKSKGTKSEEMKRTKSRKQRRKFTFSSPEEYIEYAAKRKSSVISELPVIPSLKKGEKVPEKASEKSSSKDSSKKSIGNKSIGNNWMKKYRRAKKHTFSSPEEYMKEYTARKSVAMNSDAVDKKFAVAIGTPVDVDCENSESESINEWIRAQTENNNISDSFDLETARTSGSTSGGEEQKTCGRLSLADVAKVSVLWVVITTLIIFLARDPPADPIIIVATNATTAPTTINNDELGCSLCSGATSVLNPDLEIATTDFCRQSEDSSCFFQCSDPLTAPRVYTCGEVEQLAMEASSSCSSGGDDSVDGCAAFEQAASQCCFEDSGWEETFEKQATQTKRSVNHLRTNAGD